MSLNINGKDIGRRELTILIACLIVIVGVIIASLVVYQDKKQQTSVAAQEASVQREEDMKKAQADQAAREAAKEAQMNRLVSICIQAQERFDALTTKQKATESRPDCTVNVQ